MNDDLSRPRAKVKRRLLVALCIFFLGAIVALIGQGIGIDAERVSFVSTGGVRIEGFLFSPEGRPSERLPALVFCHGLLASKEIYVYGERRLARSGMRVLAIDLRGHGRSGGFSDFGKSESIDVLAAVDFLRTRADVDPGRIALAGHSLGGITVTRAGAEDAGKKTRAVAAIYCWPGFQDAVESIFGPLDGGFLGNLWPSFAWSRTFPLSEDELRSRDVLPMLSPDRRPPNYLLVHGAREVLTSEDKARDLVARAAGRQKVELDVTVGDHRRLTARRFTMVGGGHAFEAINPGTFLAIESWLSKCLRTELSFAGRDFGLAVSMAGTLLALAAALYVYGLVRTWFALKVPRREIVDDGGRPRVWLAVVAGAGVVAVSAPGFRLAGVVETPLLVRTWFGDVMATYALWRIVLALPLLAVLALAFRKRLASFLRSLIPGAPSLNEWGLGLAPALVLIASLSLLGLFLWIPPMLPKHWPSFLALFSILFIHYLIEEGVFRGIVARSIPGRGRRTALVMGLIGGLGLAAAFIACFPSLSYSIQFPRYSLPMAPVVIALSVLAYYSHSTLTTFLHRRTRNILVPAAAMALLLAWLLTSFGVRAA